MGIVVDAEKASRTHCKCYRLKESQLCFSPGVIGALNEVQRTLYCNPKIVLGTDFKKVFEDYVKIMDAIEVCGGLGSGEFEKCVKEEAERSGVEF